MGKFTYMDVCPSIIAEAALDDIFLYHGNAGKDTSTVSLAKASKTMNLITK